jgi:nickel transport protein
VGQDQLRAIVREELKAQIGPVMRALAETEDDRTPGLREIVGGLGWIVGILGLIIIVRGRKGPKSAGKD